MCQSASWWRRAGDECSREAWGRDAQGGLPLGPGIHRGRQLWWWEIPGCVSGGGGGGRILKEGLSSGLWGGRAGPKGEQRKQAEGREGKGRGCLGPAESWGAETSQAHVAFRSEAGIAVTAGSEAGRGHLTLDLRNTSRTAGAPSPSPSLPGSLCWGRGTRQVLGQPGGLS